MKEIRFNARGEIIVPWFRVGVADMFDLHALLRAASQKRGA
jgi:hypothetical protein